MNRIALPRSHPILVETFGRWVDRWEAGGRNMRVQLRRIVWALLGIQAVLALALIGTTLTTSSRVTALIMDRLYPIGELQRVNANYTTALLTAHKVRSGNLSAMGAVATIAGSRAEIATSWRAFTRHHFDTRSRGRSRAGRRGAARCRCGPRPFARSVALAPDPAARFLRQRCALCGDRSADRGQHRIDRRPARRCDARTDRVGAGVRRSLYSRGVHHGCGDPRRYLGVCGCCATGSSVRSP